MQVFTPDSGFSRVPARVRARVLYCACATALAIILSAPVAAQDLSPATTDLFEAIQRNDLAAVQISIANGADISARSIAGRLPVDMAVDKGHFEIAHYLLSLRNLPEATEEGPDAEATIAASPTETAAQTVPGPEAPPAPDLSQLSDLPPEAPATLPPGVVDPFDPAAVPMGTAHPVVVLSGDTGGPAIIEPPGETGAMEIGSTDIEPPPAAPDVPTRVDNPPAIPLRPQAPSVDVSEVTPPPPQNKSILNRLGNILGIGETPGDVIDVPPPPPPDAGVTSPDTDLISPPPAPPVSADLDNNEQLARDKPSILPATEKANSTAEVVPQLPFVPEIPPEVRHPKPEEIADTPQIAEEQAMQQPEPAAVPDSEVMPDEQSDVLSDPDKPEVIADMATTPISSETTEAKADFTAVEAPPPAPIVTPSAEAPEVAVEKPAQVAEEDSPAEDSSVSAGSEVTQAEAPEVASETQAETELPAGEDEPAIDALQDDLAQLPDDVSDEKPAMGTPEPDLPMSPPEQPSFETSVEIVGEGDIAEPEMTDAPPPMPDIPGPAVIPSAEMVAADPEPPVEPDMPGEEEAPVEPEMTAESEPPSEISEAEELLPPPPPAPEITRTESRVSMPLARLPGATEAPAVSAPTPPMDSELLSEEPPPLPPEDTAPESPISTLAEAPEPEQIVPEVEEADASAIEETAVKGSTSEPDAAATQQGAEPTVSEQPATEVAAADPATPSDQPEGFVKSRLRKVAEDFPRTVDTYLGGWFIKWMGEKMGLVEKPPAETPEQTDETTQVAELSPDQAASRTDGGLQEPGFDELGSDIDGDITDTQQTADIEPEPEPEPENQPQEAANDEGQLAQVETEETLGQLAEDVLPEVPADDGGLAEAAALIVLDEEPSSGDMTAETADTAQVAELSESEIDDEIEAEAALSEPDNGPVVEVEVDNGFDELAGNADQPEATAEVDAEMGGLSGIDDEFTTDQSAETVQVTEISEEDQLAELGDDLPDPNADPFAPDAVPPGTEHPVVGDKPLVTPPLPGADEAEIGDELADDLEDGLSDDLAENLEEVPPGLEAETDELDSLATELDDGAPENAANANTDASGGGEGDLIDQLSDFLESDEGATLESDEPLPGLEETPSETDELDALAGTLEVNETQTAMLPPVVARNIPDTVLTLGESIHLTAAMPPEPDDPSERNYCVKKNRGAVVFCVEPVDWPPDLAEELRVSSIMYQGTQAVVRYDEQQVSRLHSIFPSQAFDTLVSYYSRRFGEPTEIKLDVIAPFAQPRQENPIMLWRRTDPLSGELTTLEIRRFDDSRGGFPDLKHGAVMLFNAKSGPIFPTLSSLDLMPTTGTN